MATYFHGVPEIQPVDGLQTLYLMNPSYAAYTADSSSSPTTSHHHHPNNMLFFNSPLSSVAAQPPTPPPQNPQHYVGIPLQTLQDSSYSLWAPNMSSIDFQSQLAMKTRGPSSSSDAPGSSSQQQGLSLSLSPEVQAAVAAAAVAGEGGRGGEEVKMVGVMGSKYLKAAQELLDEMVSVGKGSIHGGREKGKESRDKIAGKEEEENGGDGGSGSGGGGGGDLSTAERQELQMKKAKLVHMLDEVIKFCK